MFSPCFQLLSFFFFLFFFLFPFNSISISITQNLLFPRSTQLPTCEQSLAQHIPESWYVTRLCLMTEAPFFFFFFPPRMSGCALERAGVGVGAFTRAGRKQFSRVKGVNALEMPQMQIGFLCLSVFVRMPFCMSVDAEIVSASVTRWLGPLLSSSAERCWNEHNVLIC